MKRNITKLLNSPEADQRFPALGREVLCIGEVLWDVFPSGRFLGGAPLNVACHLRSLGQPAVMVSRIGNDTLGQELLDHLPKLGLSTDLIQVDSHLPTGQVTVGITRPLIPAYKIETPASWDAIEDSESLVRRTSRARAIVFGSLSQRDERSRRTIQKLVTSTKALRVFDVNLRPPFDNRAVVEQSLLHADLVKLNEHELDCLRDWFDLSNGTMEKTSAAIAGRFGCRSVCITRGSAGAAMWHHGSWYEHCGWQVSVLDTVGAGDSFLAALLVGLIKGNQPDKVLQHANAVGGFVATQRGATPPLDHQAIQSLMQSPSKTSPSAVAAASS